MRTSFLALTAALAGLAMPAAAQDDTESTPEEETEEVVEPIRRYTVELIVYAYGEGVSAGTEIWLPETPEISETQEALPDRFFPTRPSKYRDSDDELAEIEVPAIGRRYMDVELVLFGEDDYTMSDIYDKLVELEAYKPVVRAGWTQLTYERDLTGSIALQILADCPPWLDGNLTLYLGRYLHLVVDLIMDADRPVIEEPEDETAVEPTFNDSHVQSGFGPIDAYGELLTPPIRYRIFEDRIVKNGDVRYFDHPKFGVIAKITRYEEPEVPEEDEFVDDTDDLLPG